MTGTALKTYWHLAQARRKPSRYDIVSSRLLYYPTKQFAVQNPVTRWYEQYQRDSAIPPQRYATFRDPRTTTYQSYVELKHERELILDHAHRSLDTDERRARLTPAWLDELESVLPVLRFPYQGLHMAAAYCGQMAPQSELVIAFALQAADELGRIEQFAIRMSELRRLRADFGEGSRSSWEGAPAWQPIRAVLERLLVTYDFGEAWVACNLVVKPVLDRLCLHELASRAEANQDPLTAQVLGCLMHDSSWQNAWTRDLAAQAIGDDPTLQACASAWVNRWWGELQGALPTLLQLWCLSSQHQQRLLGELALERAQLWRSVGLEVAP